MLCLCGRSPTKPTSSWPTPTGYSLTDLGIDPLTFVEWMLVDFDYQLDGAYDNGDGTAPCTPM